MDEERSKRTAFDNLITSISTGLIRTGPKEMDQAIRRALRAIGEFAGADRSYVFLFRDDLERMDNTHEWCAPGVPPYIGELQNLETATFPWWMEHIRRFETVHVPCVRDLPPEANAEREIFEYEGIQSLIAVPIACAGSLKGFLGFDAVTRERDWAEETIALLRISSDALAQALERTRVEEALREERDRAQRYLDVAGVLIVAIGADEKVKLVNRKACSVLGYEEEYILSRNWFDHFIPEETREDLRSVFRSLLSGDVVSFQRHESPLLDREGERRVVAWHNTVLRDHDGNVTGTLSSGEDITARRLAEDQLRIHREHLEDLVGERTRKLQEANAHLVREIRVRKRAETRAKRLNEELERRVQERTAELERAYQDLKEMDKMKDKFVSSVSHELRTPLTSIRSFTELLLQYDKDPGERQEFLGIIRSESERLSRLIDDVLDLSRIESGGMVWNDGPTDVGAAIRDVVRTQGVVLRQKSLRVNLGFHPELPPVRMDPDRLRQVLMNLLANAVKFSFDGGAIGISAEVLRGRRRSDPSYWIRVGVSDQGVGIDEKDQKIVFDRFGQVTTDSLRDKPKGTGLGLPICEEIVSHYGGSIWVESAVGAGSTFYFTLPVDGCTMGREEPRREQRGAPATDAEKARRPTHCQDTR